ncbi:hypothetical protein H2203_003274 [Taxawa tesnikishii (nom. ined.)]|nr:hypothetical protein H2203_003274 [Dothideales sp. JES 119]
MRSKFTAHLPRRLFVLLSGLAHVTLPTSDDEAWIMEGVNGLVVAADVIGVGHYTSYPSDKETIALQLPFANGQVPPHEVLGRSACRSSQRILLQGLEVPWMEGVVQDVLGL